MSNCSKEKHQAVILWGEKLLADPEAYDLDPDYIDEFKARIDELRLEVQEQENLEKR